MRGNVWVVMGMPIKAMPMAFWSMARTSQRWLNNTTCVAPPVRVEARSSFERIQVSFGTFLLADSMVLGIRKCDGFRILQGESNEAKMPIFSLLGSAFLCLFLRRRYILMGRLFLVVSYPECEASNTKQMSCGIVRWVFEENKKNPALSFAVYLCGGCTL
jgi:hypothetical protein